MEDTLPSGSIPFVLYETLRAAAFMEHHSEIKNSVGRRHIEKIKHHFGSAYPGSGEVIDRIQVKNVEFVRNLLGLIQSRRFGWQTAEDYIVTNYPQLSNRDTEKIAVLVCLIKDSNEFYSGL